MDKGPHEIEAMPISLSSFLLHSPTIEAKPVGEAIVISAHTKSVARTECAQATKASK